MNKATGGGGRHGGDDQKRHAEVGRQSGGVTGVDPASSSDTAPTETPIVAPVAGRRC